MTLSFMPPAVGDQVHVAGITPAPGANYQLVIPAGEAWQVQVFKFRLVTDANVASRRARVHFNQAGGAVVTWLVHSPLTQTAGVNTSYVFAVGLPNAPTAADLFNYHPLPAASSGPGGTLNIEIVTIQVGDAISQVELLYQRWRV